MPRAPATMRFDLWPAEIGMGRGDQRCRRPADARRRARASQRRPSASSAVGRLVEQPDRPPRDQEPGQRQPPLLPGRENRRRDRSHRPSPTARARAAMARPRHRTRSPRRRDSRRRSARLDAVEMAEKVRLFGDRSSASPPSSDDPARSQRQQLRRARAAASTCRRRSARSRQQGLAGLQRQRDAVEHQPPAALHADLLGDQPHGGFLPGMSPKVNSFCGSCLRRIRTMLL